MLLKTLTKDVSCLLFKPEAVSKYSVSLWIGYSENVWIMILKQKAFQKLEQIMKLKENQEKKTHPGIEPEFNKKSICMVRNSSTPIPLGHIAVDTRCVITCTVQVNRTSWLRQTNDKKFCKITKYAFLKQNNFLRIDELTYNSSIFYKLKFVSRRQFFINIGKYPSKMQKVGNDPFLCNKIFKRTALFSD